MTRTMLLIDADNVSTDVMEQAVSALLREHGALHVRRAYCTAESALKHQSLFKRLGIRPMVNLSAGKNSTDIALAVDALDLVLSERPDVVAIASSDSDFAPLVGRLREKGCRVVGIGQQGKTGDATQAAYDAFTVLTHRRVEASPAPVPARKTATQRAAATKASGERSRGATAGAAGSTSDRTAGSSAGSTSGGSSAGSSGGSSRAAPRAGARGGSRRSKAAAGDGDDGSSADTSAATPATAVAASPAEAPAKTAGRASSSAAPAGAPATPARKTPRRRTAAAKKTAGAAPAPAAAAAAASAPAPARAPSTVPDTVRQILTALPELVRGDTVELRVAASRLREAGLLSKSGVSTKVFSAHGDRFELLPASNPNKVRLRT